MFSLACYLIAALLFLLAGCNQDLFSQPELDEIAFAGFFAILGVLLSGWGPAAPKPRGRE